jgi:hypothetical protein
LEKPGKILQKSKSKSKNRRTQTLYCTDDIIDWDNAAIDNDDVDNFKDLILETWKF